MGCKVRTDGMKLNPMAALAPLAAMGAAALGWAVAAQAQGQPQGQQIPKTWNYDLRGGRRVPKANRVTNSDGSWREELKQGNCVTIKERAASGEYKETRECNPS
jgi:hypothetical protein